MLKKTVENGTGRNAKIDRSVAGKTGTSQSLRDAWFIGFSSHMVAGVWFGNDDDSPMKKITGGTAPAKLWSDFMLKAHEDIPKKELSNLMLPSKPVINKHVNKKVKKESGSIFERIIEDLISGN